MLILKKNIKHTSSVLLTNPTHLSFLYKVSGPEPAGGATVVAELALLAPLGPAEFIRHIALTTLKKMN